MKYLNNLLLLISFITGMNAYSQDGEKLFKTKCSTCHQLEADATGPNLKGVHSKWEEAGELDFLYEWVKDPQTLIATGKSKMATAIKDYSPTGMTPQPLSSEEVDAVLAYVDSYVKEVETPKNNPTETEIVYVPNYKKNLNLFYFLIVLLIVQAIAILTIGRSTKTVIKSEFIDKIKDKSAVIIALVGLFGLTALNNQSFALEFMQPGLAEENAPWLLVEDSDIRFLVILNVIVLGLLLYMRKSFMDLLKTLRPHAFVKVKKEKTSKVTKILTDVVPIEEEESILMHHEYDGIRELDNNLPPWWLWGFYASIVFAVIYIFNYHVLKTSDLQIEAYNKDTARAEKEIAAYLESQAMNVDENSATLLTDNSDISAGKAIFSERCVSCHTANGSGDIGPNLTDKTWIYGYDVKDLFKTIKYGTGKKGMPEHESKLNPVQIQQVASYVLSMPEATGKAPEGEIKEE